MLCAWKLFLTYFFALEEQGLCNRDPCCYFFSKYLPQTAPRLDTVLKIDYTGAETATMDKSSFLVHNGIIAHKTALKLLTWTRTASYKKHHRLIHIQQSISQVGSAI